MAHRTHSMTGGGPGAHRDTSTVNHRDTSTVNHRDTSTVSSRLWASSPGREVRPLNGLIDVAPRRRRRTVARTVFDDALEALLDAGGRVPCANQPEWTSDDPADAAWAASVCGRCPILAACDRLAAAERPTAGVWAGRRWRSTPRSWYRGVPVTPDTVTAVTVFPETEQIAESEQIGPAA